MFCPECGKQIGEDALFCPECGTALPNNQQPRSIEDESPVQNCEIATTREVDAETATSETEVSPNNATNENGQSGSANASMPQSGTTQPTPSGETTGTKAGKVIDDAIDKFKSLDKTKKYGILGGGIAVVVLVAIVAFVMPLFGGVPTDVARQAFAQSSLATNGAVSNNYTNESAYEIKDFKIDKQEDALAGYDSDTRQMAKAWYGTDQLKIVYFSGTIANDSFETNFTGECDFKNVNGTWSKASDYSLTIDSKSTKPLKGVDTLGGGQNSSSGSNNASYSDFSSDFNESNGTYTSNATGTVAYTYWFATDTAKVSQSFTFDPSSGWKTSGDAQTTDKNTEWTLKDKTFKWSGDGDHGTVDSTITFGEASNGTISASYDFSYTPNGGVSNSFCAFNSVSLKGAASGKATHQFGSDNFTLQLSDTEQSVDITCRNNGFYSSSSKNTFTVDATTKTPYKAWKTGDKDNFYLTSRNFTEATQTNA